MSSETAASREIQDRDWEFDWVDESVIAKLDIPEKPQDSEVPHEPFFAIGAIRDYEVPGLGRIDVLYASYDGKWLMNAEYIQAKKQWDEIWRCIWVPADANVGEAQPNIESRIESALRLHSTEDSYDELLEEIDTDQREY